MTLFTAHLAPLSVSHVETALWWRHYAVHYNMTTSIQHQQYITPNLCLFVCLQTRSDNQELSNPNLAHILVP